MNKLFSKLLFRLHMFWLKIKFPTSGCYERVCLLAGYKRSDIDDWLEEAEGCSIYGDMNREDFCEVEVSYFED